MTLASQILVVDDSESNLLLVARILERAGYTHVDTMLQSADVLGFFEAHPPDLLVLDLQMPAPDGIAVMAQIERWTSGDTYVPVLVLTADASQDARHRALEAGARDFLTKPLDHVEVLLRIRNLLQTRELQVALQDQNEVLEARVRHRTHDLDQARLEAFRRLALAAEYRDDETRVHTQRVGRLAGLIALEMGVEPADAEVLEQVAPLHDLGKIGIPDAILLKPGRLTEKEFELMKTHTSIGAEIMAGTHSPLFELAAQIALCHHEHWDGSGYPRGLAGEAIPFEARIVGLVDVFDALAHRRPYKPPWPVDEALAEIARSSGSHFDPAIATAFAALDRDTLTEIESQSKAPSLTSSAWDALHKIGDIQLTPDLFQAIFERHPWALVIANDELRCVAANASARALLRVSDEQLRSRHLPDFIIAERRPDSDRLWAEFQRAGTQNARTDLDFGDGEQLAVRYLALANVLPGYHLISLEPIPDPAPTPA